jgi:hypothetical protein
MLLGASITCTSIRYYKLGFSRHSRSPGSDQVTNLSPTVAQAANRLAQGSVGPPAPSTTMTLESP